MPTLTLSTTVPKSATAHDVAVFSDEIGQLSPDQERMASLQGFEGKVGQTLVLSAPVDEPVRVLVGLGVRAELDRDALRRAAAAFVRAVGRHKVAATTLVEAAGSLGLGVAIEAVAEGVGLASYRYTQYKSASGSLRRVNVVARGAGAKAAFTRATATIAGVSLARDLINHPGGHLTPVAFADAAKVACKNAGVKISVWDEKRIARERLGGVLAVNQGSTHPPRFLVMDYVPTGKATGSVALVGKGITFDSGGLSIKTGTGMMTMKVDMAGGAAVLAAMTMLGAYGVKARVTGYVPLTDNMINGDAIRPGDVFVARNGKSVEVLNTDAEGRLVLADALSLASEKSHDAIIDIATLTGSVSGALGTSYAGIMGSHDGLLGAIEGASQGTGERVWRLPLPEKYRSQLDSTVADLKNIGAGPYGGALVAGLFLKEFVDGPAWAHIDLGLAAMAEADDGVITKGGTGFGARLLAELLRDWTPLED